MIQWLSKEMLIKKILDKIDRKKEKQRFGFYKDVLSDEYMEGYLDGYKDILKLINNM